MISVANPLAAEAGADVLAQGGSKDAMDLFVAFKGREPSVDALLRHSGFGAGATEAAPPGAAPA